MTRPLLSLVLAFVALVAIAWAVGAATGWYSMSSILSDAVLHTLHGFADWLVGGVRSFLSDVIADSVPW